MNNAGPLFSLVLIGRYPGKDLAVAQALARCMGRDESWGLKVVSAAPILIFERLADAHARAIQNALNEVADAGCKFEIESGANSAYPKVGWSGAPKINGRELAEITGDAALKCPPSQSNQTEQSNQSGPLSTPAGQPQDNSRNVTATLILPCPYTGRKLKLTLAVTLQPDDTGTGAALEVTAVASRVSAAERSANAQTGSIVLPAISQTPRGSGAIPIAASKTGAMPVPYPSSASDTGLNLRDKNAMVATTVARPMSSDHALPAASWRRKTPHDIPLPDVPILPHSAPAPAPAGRQTEKNPWPLDSKPMDLSDFERQLGVEGNAPERPLVNAGDFEVSDSSSTMVALLDDEFSEQQILCSVFIDRSSNPIVHELVAELHGIPEAEASEMCVSGLVALAENIPLDAASDIQRRCAEINVIARIERHET